MSLPTLANSVGKVANSFFARLTPARLLCVCVAAQCNPSVASHATLAPSTLFSLTHLPLAEYGNYRRLYSQALRAIVLLASSIPGGIVPRLIVIKGADEGKEF